MSNFLFHVIDPRSIQVILHQSRYLNHIWPSHPIVEVDDIRLVIVEPDLITQDIQSNEIEIIIDKKWFQNFLICI